MMVNGERVRVWRQTLRDLAVRGKPQLRLAGSVLAGAVLSAGALAGNFQPFALGLLCAAPPGWHSVALALGGGIGYGAFWGKPGLQGTAWMACGLAASLAAERQSCRSRELLRPALAALAAAGTGVLFQRCFGDETPVGMFLLRVAVAAGSAAVFSVWRQRREGWSRWAVQTVGVLCLAQIHPVRYLGLGYAAAGILGAAGNFPSAVLSGLALDLGGGAAVCMTGAMCLGCCIRRIPGSCAWWGCLSSGMGYLLMAALGGGWEIRPLPPLLLGGAVAGMFPEAFRGLEVRLHAGEAAVAQVRLERMALALRQMEQSLGAVGEPEVDTRALLQRAKSDACDTCPERKGCKARLTALPEPLLDQPGLGEEDLPRGCRKPARLLASLRRSQEQLRRIRGDRSRLRTYRRATREQYGFLADYLQGVSDDLATRREVRPIRFEPEVAVRSRSVGADCGDRCTGFAGPGNDYYVLLCDGMGTGAEAARESRAAGELLQQMLCAGLPARYALRSLNSLAILRQLGGCSTVDLLQLQLDTGRGVLYKWGAAPSCLLRDGQLQRLGEQTPPPGVSQDCRESALRVNLSRGEILILHSDGAAEAGLLRLPREMPDPEALADWVLRQGTDGSDDATVAAVRLKGLA